MRPILELAVQIRAILIMTNSHVLSARRLCRVASPNNCLSCADVARLCPAHICRPGERIPGQGTAASSGAGTTERPARDSCSFAPKKWGFVGSCRQCHESRMMISIRHRR
jgi:hypothetical protein